MILNGVYTVDGKTDVHLIEVTFDNSPETVDVGKITQEVEGLTKGSWQSPWDEKYLDENGEKVIGDCFDIPEGQTKTRLLFYMHFIDFGKPLITQFGQLRFTKPTSTPARLAGLTKYDDPD